VQGGDYWITGIHRSLFADVLCSAVLATLPADSDLNIHALLHAGALVLTSGDSSVANCEINNNDAHTGWIGNAGDPDLDLLIPGFTTYDAVSLEFDVTPLKDGYLVFRYVFGSDEYNEWVGSPFNDVFGFFIGPNKQNVAIVKGTADTQVNSSCSALLDGLSA
jgi:hypothetical protein